MLTRCNIELQNFLNVPRMATYSLKIAYFSYPSLIQRPRSPCSLWNFAVKLSMLEIRVMGLSSSEDPMIVA